MIRVEPLKIINKESTNDSKIFAEQIKRRVVEKATTADY